MAAEARAEAHRANSETGAAAVYTAPGAGGAYDTSTGTYGAGAGTTHTCTATMGGAGTTRREGTTIELEDRLAVVTGLTPAVEPMAGGRLTTAVEDYAVVGVQRHAIGDATVSHTLRLRDA